MLVLGGTPFLAERPDEVVETVTPYPFRDVDRGALVF